MSPSSADSDDDHVLEDVGAGDARRAAGVVVRPLAAEAASGSRPTAAKGFPVIAPTP